MEIKLKLEGHYWQQFLMLLKKLPYIKDIEIIQQVPECGQPSVQKRKKIEKQFTHHPQIRTLK